MKTLSLFSLGLLILSLGTVITGNLLGTYKKQVGKTFVFAVWKGIQYFRKWVKGTYSRTTAQAYQRNLFTSCLLIAQGIITTVIQKFWRKYAVKMSSFNAWMRSNLLVNHYPIVASELIMSKGALTPTPIVTASWVPATGIVTLTWDPTLIGNQAIGDYCAFVIYCKTPFGLFVRDFKTLRSAGTDSLDVGIIAPGSSLYAYLFFYRDLSTQFEKIANSSYLVCTEA